MKKTIILIISALVAFAASDFVCVAAPSAPAQGVFQKKKKELKTITLSANIHCKNCANKVRENIGFEKGVEGLEVSVEKRQVVITYDVAKTDLATLLAAMKKIGYPATVLAE